MATPYVSECKDEYGPQGAYSPMGRQVYKQIIPTPKGICADGGVCSKGFGNPRRSLA